MAKKQPKPVKTKATTKKPPLPDYYLTDQPFDPNRANFTVVWDRGQASAHASAPANHLTSLTGLTIGVIAPGAPVAALAITCSAELPVSAIITATAMVTVVSLVALALLIYLLRKGDPSP